MNALFAMLNAALAYVPAEFAAVNACCPEALDAKVTEDTVVTFGVTANFGDTIIAIL